MVHFTLTDCFGVKHCAFSYFMDPTSNRDALREGPVRLLGYANEVGESMKPVVPHAAYLASYGVAGLYVLGDAAWRGTRPPVAS